MTDNAFDLLPGVVNQVWAFVCDGERLIDSKPRLQAAGVTHCTKKQHIKEALLKTWTYALHSRSGHGLSTALSPDRLEKSASRECTLAAARSGAALCSIRQRPGMSCIETTEAQPSISHWMGGCKFSQAWVQGQWTAMPCGHDSGRSKLSETGVEVSAPPRHAMTSLQ